MINFGNSKRKSSNSIPEKYDMIFFGIGKLEFCEYNKSYSYLPPYPAGDLFHIMYAKQFNKNSFDYAMFNAILIDPVQYILSIIENGYSGCVGRVSNGGETETIFRKLYNDILKSVEKETK